MTTILQLILLTSIIVIGVTIVTQEGMLLSSIRESVQENKSKIFDAIIRCVWCMPSIWTSVGYLFAKLTGVVDHFSWQLVFMYPIVVCGSSFLCGVSWMLYTKIEIQIRYYEKEEENSYLNLKDRRERFKSERNVGAKTNHH